MHVKGYPFRGFENGSLNYHTTHKNYQNFYYRALRGDYGLHNHPITQAIGKIVKKFEETVVVTNIERPVHHRVARSAENTAIVS